MNKTLKIILIVFGLLIIGLGGLIMLGMYSMEIEDTYGDNQDIFHNSRQGDLVINHDTKELGQITKTWTKFYVIHHADTLNINSWWDDKNIEIFRPIDKEVSPNKLDYADIDALEGANKIELIKKLR
jgi:hypothetical protein